MSGEILEIFHHGEIFDYYWDPLPIEEVRIESLLRFVRTLELQVERALRSDNKDLAAKCFEVAAMCVKELERRGKTDVDFSCPAIVGQTEIRHG